MHGVPLSTKIPCFVSLCKNINYSTFLIIFFCFHLNTLIKKVTFLLCQSELSVLSFAIFNDVPGPTKRTTGPREQNLSSCILFRLQSPTWVCGCYPIIGCTITNFKDFHTLPCPLLRSSNQPYLIQAEYCEPYFCRGNKAYSPKLLRFLLLRPNAWKIPPLSKFPVVSQWHYIYIDSKFEHTEPTPDVRLHTKSELKVCMVGSQ